MLAVRPGLGARLYIFPLVLPVSALAALDTFPLESLADTGMAFPLRLDADVFKALQDGMDWEAAAREGIGTRRLLDTHIYDESSAGGVGNSAVVGAAASDEVMAAAAAALNVSADELALISSDIFCKPPMQEDKFIGWHQDQSWWGVQPAESLANVWIAVDHSDEHSGCVRYLPGSHRSGVVHPHEAMVPGNQLYWSVNVSDSEAASAVCVQLTPGNFIVFSGLIVHKSAPNTSKRRRCGIVLRFTRWPASLKTDYVVGGKAYHPTPIRIHIHHSVKQKDDL